MQMLDQAMVAFSVSMEGQICEAAHFKAMKLGDLKRLALAKGIPKEYVNNVDEEDDPKASVIEPVDEFSFMQYWTRLIAYAVCCAPYLVEVIR